jgi:hypothetical protein
MLIPAKGRLVSIPIRTEFRGVKFSVNAKLTGHIDRNYPHAHEVEHNERPGDPPHIYVQVEVAYGGTKWLPALSVFVESGDALSEVLNDFRWASVKMRTA